MKNSGVGGCVYAILSATMRCCSSASIGCLEADQWHKCLFPTTHACRINSNKEGSRQTGRLVPPRRPRPYQTLPHVSIGDVTGLIELVHASGDRADLYQLGCDLQLEVDELLPLVDAADPLELADP